MTGASKSVLYTAVNSNQRSLQTGEIIVESPVSLTVNGEYWLTFMCTPVDLEALAIGFLYNENLIQTFDEIIEARLCPAGDNIDVWLNHQISRPKFWRKTSGCTGGVTSIEGDTTSLTHVKFDDFLISSRKIWDLVEILYKSQDLYNTSGGVHTSILTDGDELIITGEDIGRHNTLDKIAGKFLLEQPVLHRRFLLTTGRVSSEMLQKANRLEAAFVISRTSSSSLSVKMAEVLGITLIGYARRGQYRIYSHPGRIIANDPNEKE